jgi:uncharacterized protein YoxC
MGGCTGLVKEELVMVFDILEVDIVVEEVDTVAEEVDTVVEEVYTVAEEVDTVAEEVDTVAEEVDTVVAEVYTGVEEVDTAPGLVCSNSPHHLRMVDNIEQQHSRGPWQADHKIDKP